jgi:hypothetical protein
MQIFSGRKKVELQGMNNEKTEESEKKLLTIMFL